MAPPKRPWFRLYTEAFSDRKLRRLAPAERWLFVAVLGAARQSPVPGVLLITETEPLTVEDLADFAGMKERDVTVAIEKMDRLGLVYERSDGALVVTKWEARQFEADDVTARTRKHRSKGKPPDDHPPGMERSIERSNGDEWNGDSPPNGNVPGTHQSQRQKTDTPSQSSVTATGPRPEPVDDDDRDPLLALVTATAVVLGDRDHQRRLAADLPEPVVDRRSHRQRCIERWCGDQRLADAAVVHGELDPEQLADVVDPPTRPLLTVVPETPPMPPEYEPEPAVDVVPPEVVRAALAAARQPRSAG